MKLICAFIVVLAYMYLIFICIASIKIAWDAISGNVDRYKSCLHGYMFKRDNKCPFLEGIFTRGNGDIVSVSCYCRRNICLFIGLI